MTIGANDWMIAMKNNTRTFLLASTARISVSAFAAAGWKLDADGKIEMKDGNPVWVDSNGAESVMAGDTISRLNGEAKGHREAKEKAETALEAFKVGGKLIDAPTAIKALDTVGKLDAKQLIDAGEVDRVKDTVKAEFTGQINELNEGIKQRDGKINEMLIGQVFSGSDFIRDRVAMPRDFFEASMRANFKVEDGKVVAYDKSGNKLMSKAKIGEYADPDEALELLVSNHPQRDTILKAEQAGGTGSNGGGGARPGGRTMKRDVFDQLGPNEKANAAAAAGKGEMQIVD